MYAMQIHACDEFCELRHDHSLACVIHQGQTALWMKGFDWMVCFYEST